MVYLKEKKIGNKKYLYLTKSIRLPDGTVKTIQKLVKKSGPKSGHLEWFWEAEKKAAKKTLKVLPSVMQVPHQKSLTCAL